VRAKRVAYATNDVSPVLVAEMRGARGGAMDGSVARLVRAGERLRQLMLFDSRGHPAADHKLLASPTWPHADTGYIVVANADPATSRLERRRRGPRADRAGLAAVVEPVTTRRLANPAAPMVISAVASGGRARSITLRKVSAFAVLLESPVDVAWGGISHVLNQAVATVVPEQGERIAVVGERPKLVAYEQLGPIAHLTLTPSDGITIAATTGPDVGAAGATTRNSVIVSTGNQSLGRPECSTGSRAGGAPQCGWRPFA